MMKRILSVGKFKHPLNSNKPYYIEIEFFADKDPVIQDVDEKTFFKIIDEIIVAHKPKVLISVN